MTPSRFVHWRAAAPGATTMALMSTTPTVWSPMTIAMTSKVVNRTSMRPIGSPRVVPNSGSKLRSLNSFQNTATVAMATAPSSAIVTTSLRTSAAAWPNRNVSSPAWLASGWRCTNVSSIRPIPKNTESTRPRAPSSLILVVRTIERTTSVPSHPAPAALMRSASGDLPPMRNPITTPGSAAWEMASPRRLCLRSTAKEPSTPLTIPRAPAPRATVRSV